MRAPRLSLIFLTLGVLWTSALFPGAAAAPGRLLEPKDFDRLDGHGPTAKKVDVIEWEGNLEIHVYPKGALKSLGMKIDKESKTTANKVMVIEYGFNGVPYTLIRRAVLSISLPETFKAFRDETAENYDKIIVSGHTLADVKIYALASPPTQLYPDYHPSLEADEPAKTYTNKNAGEGPSPASVNASGSANKPGNSIQFQSADEVKQDANGTIRRRDPKPVLPEESDGSIRSFAF